MYATYAEEEVEDKEGVFDGAVAALQSHVVAP